MSLKGQHSTLLLKTREFAIKSSEIAPFSNYSPLPISKYTGMCHETIRNRNASLLNSTWQNCKERPNRSTNNGDMTETAKRYVN